MSDNKNQQIYLTGIEVGTKSIKVLIGRLASDTTLEVVGFGEAPSLKMCKGEAQAPQIVSEQVMSAVAQAKSNAGLEEITGLYFISFSGGYIETKKVSASVEITNPEQIVYSDDFEAAVKATNVLDISDDLYHLPLLVNHLTRLGDGRVMFNPLGQSSSTLEVETLHFIADFARANTMFCIITEAFGGRPPNSIIYTPLTLGAALQKEEASDDALELLIDIGAGMTSIAVPTSVGHLFCGQIAVGCDHIANDISLAFDLPIQAARQILEQMGSLPCTAVATHDNNARIVNCALPSQHTQKLIPASSLEIVVEARLQELFEMIRRQLEDKQVFSWIGNRIVLSGGGALIPRVTDLAKRVFGRSEVEIAKPYDIVSRGDFKPLPQYVTVIGLIRAGYQDYIAGIETARRKDSLKNRMKQIWNVITDW